MTAARKIAACDCETDPFKHDRRPEPFVWGFYDGHDFLTFNNTEDFVNHVKDKEIILYAHNGGKFDFIFLLKYIGETKMQVIGGRIVSMYLGRCELIDSYSAVPESMDKIQKKKIDYSKLERAIRHRHMDEIIEYMKWDCIYLYDLMKKNRAIAGTKKTIASNALAFARKLGIDVGKTNYRFDEKYRDFFYGGRTEVFNPGTHHDISIIDVRSAYPRAMMEDHATGSDFERIGSLKGLTREEINRCFIMLDCYSDGAFPKRILGSGGGLSFPKAYDTYHVTGWEYLAAQDNDLISRETIQSVRYTEAKLNFKPYVEHWYKYKAEHPKSTFPIEYTIGKTMMVSLYGKTAQNPTRYYDYRVVPAGTMICDEPRLGADDKCSNCGRKGLHHGWVLYSEFEDHEIHRRESLWKHRYEHGEEWKGRNIFYNVATGASITGWQRAHLLRAQCLVGREHTIYGDTDSLMCGPGADLSKIPFSEKLGDWDLEDIHCPVGYFAGKKLYGIRHSEEWIKNNPGKDPHKIASKGSRLNFDQLKRIANGETILWKNEAPSFKIDGTHSFVVREIRATAKPAKSSLPVTNEGEGKVPSLKTKMEVD